MDEESDRRLKAMLEKMGMNIEEIKKLPVEEVPPKDDPQKTERRNNGWLEHSGIRPEEYAKFTLLSFDPNRSPQAAEVKAKALDWLKNHKEGGPGFGAFGHSGTGKTHICIALCQELTKRFHEPHRYFSYRAEMPDLIKASRSYSADYKSAIHKWQTCRNLYIDDLFKLAGRGGYLGNADVDEMRVVYDIVNARYLNHLTTIFSSEYRLQEITNVDEAIGSRIYDMVMPYGIHTDGPNQRLRKNGGKENGLFN